MSNSFLSVSEECIHDRGGLKNRKKVKQINEHDYVTFRLLKLEVEFAFPGSNCRVWNSVFPSWMVGHILS